MTALGRPHDCVAVGLGFRSGAYGTLLSSSLGGGREISLDLSFAGGGARLEGWDLHPPLEPGEPAEDVFERETAAFLAVAAGGAGPVLSTVEDALETQRTVDAIVRSASTRRVEPV